MTRPTVEEEEEIEASKAPLLSHLVELRRRIIYSLLALGIGFIICFAFSKEIYAYLTEPMARAMAGHPNHHMIYTAVYETFFTYVKVGLFGGICLSFPVIAAQVWMFVAPGLYKHERRAFLPFLAASPILFIIGACFVYYVMLPYALRFFLGFETQGTADTPGIELQAKVSDYLDFVTALIAAFGLTFQMPVALTLLGKVGIVSSSLLRRMRRYAIVGITGLASVITPPDVFSMVSLIVPLICLYEVSIWLVWLIEKRRKADRDARDAEDAKDDPDHDPDGPSGGLPAAPSAPDDLPPEGDAPETISAMDLPGIEPPQAALTDDSVPPEDDAVRQVARPEDPGAEYDDEYGDSESDLPQMPPLEALQEVPDEEIPETGAETDGTEIPAEGTSAEDSPAAPDASADKKSESPSKPD